METKRMVEQYRQRVEQQYHRQSSLVIYPTSIFYIRWSTLVAICLVYVALVGPYETALLTTHPGSPLWIISRLLDFIFVVVSVGPGCGRVSRILS